MKATRQARRRSVEAAGMRFPSWNDRCMVGTRRRAPEPHARHGTRAAESRRFRVPPSHRKPVMPQAADTTTTIIPCLRYRDAPAAIDWLCRAFGFEKHAVYADGDTVHHAQLVFGNGMVMLGSADNASEWGRQVVQPEEIGMRETQSPCVIVADTDAHYARAKAAGATIVTDIA